MIYAMHSSTTAVPDYLVPGCGTGTATGSGELAGKKDKKKQEEAGKEASHRPSKIDTSKLVWPLPPDLPRIKFISSISANHRR